MDSGSASTEPTATLRSCLSRHVAGSWRRCNTRRGCGPARSAHVQSAVDDHRLAGHVVAVGAGQEADHAGHVLGAFGAAERDTGSPPPPRLADLPAFDLAPLGI